MGGRSRPPRVVWLVSAVHVAVCLAYAVVLPVYAGPREAEQVDQHLRAAAAPLTWSPHDRPLAPDVRGALATLHFSDDPHQRLLVNAAPERPARPPFAVLAASGDASAAGTAVVHARPPAHALLGAAWRGVAPGIDGVAHDVQVLHLRLLNVLLLAPLPVLLHAIARRLRAPAPVALGAAIAPLAIPMLGHVGGAVTADGLLVLAGGVVTLRGLDVLRGDLSPGVAAQLGVGAAVACLASGLGVALAGWTAVVLVVGARRRQRTHGELPWRAGAVVAACAAPAAAWWWHAVRAGGLPLVVPRRADGPAWLGVAQGVAERDLTAAGMSLPEGADWAVAVADLVTGVFGTFGFARAAFPLPWALVGGFVLALGAVLALAERWREPTERTDRLLLLLPVALLLAVIAVVAVGSDEPLRHVEGRHLLAGAPAVLALAVTGLGSVLGPRDRWVPAGALLAGVGAQAIALTTAAEISWGPGDAGFGESLDAWWMWVPVPVRVVAAVALPAALATVALAAATILPARRAIADRHGEPPEMRRRARRTRMVLAANALVAVVVVAALRLAERAGIPGHELVRDTLAVVDGPLHAGILSNVGILIWAVGAGACLVAGAVLRHRPELRRHARLFNGAGALTLVLAADDLLQIHEGAGIGPQWLGIPEVVIVGSYGVAALWLAVSYRDLLLALPGRWVLVAAMGGFAVSLGIDAVDTYILYVVGEDVAKLFGIVNWALGWAIAATAVVGGALTAGGPGEVGAYTPSASSKPMPQSRSRSLEE